MRDFGDTDVLGLRGYLAIATLVHPSLWVVRSYYRPEVWDPLSARFVLALLCAGVLGASFTFEWVRDRIALFCTLTLVATQGWYATTSTAQGLDVQSAVALIVVTAVGMATARELWQAAGFLLFSIGAIALAYGAVPDPAIHHIPFQILNLIVATAVGIGVQSRILAERTLEARVQERTLELEEEVVRHRTTTAALVEQEAAKKLAQRELAQARRLESLGRLAGGVAHDFNNLLTVLLWHSEALAGHPDPEVADRGSVLEGASRRAAELTAQLLNLGETALAPTVLDLASELRGLEPLLRRTVREDIHLSFRYETAPRVRMSKGRLEQLVTNLVVNAADASEPEGPVEVVLDLEESSSAIWARLSVLDRGAGMTPDTVERIFDPYFSTKGPGRGTGLGLATVLSVVQDAGGTVAVASEKGGTTFTVRLPITTEPVEAELERPSESDLELEGKRALVVDDDESVGRAVADVLLSLGMVVEVARGLTEAEELAAAHSFDVLITDVVMPGGGGLEVAHSMSELPVVFVSGHVPARLQLPEGARMVRKPFSRSHLAREVRLALESGDE